MDEKKEISDRGEFMKEYGELRTKYGLDFIAVPQFVPNERGTWELKIGTQLVSTEAQEKPFMDS